jgi:hypothetical protein
LEVEMRMEREVKRSKGGNQADEEEEEEGGASIVE